MRMIPILCLSILRLTGNQREGFVRGDVLGEGRTAVPVAIDPESGDGILVFFKHRKPVLKSIY